MRRLNLRNTFLTYITEESKRNYPKQRNTCVSFLRKSKSQYFSNIYEKKKLMIISLFFGKKIKSLLSDKVVLEEQITRVKIIDKERETPEV